MPGIVLTGRAFGGKIALPEHTRGGSGMKAKIRRPAARKARTVILVGTRKGAWILHGDSTRRQWRIDGPHFLGQIVNHLVLDPRDGRTLLAATSTGHLGPTMHRSTNLGKTWEEVPQPPAFPKAPEGAEGRTVGHTFWLQPGHAAELDVWYAGTSPQGLFRSDDGGRHWRPFSMINDDPKYREWFGSVKDGTPDGPKLHSIIVDPRDPQHMYFGMSGGGIHETTDGGAHFRPLIKGMDVFADFDPANVAFHDPHCVRMCPSNPDRLYQQNHCGIYRLDRPSDAWVRIGRNMPSQIGDIGFRRFGRGRHQLLRDDRKIAQALGRGARIGADARQQAGRAGLGVEGDLLPVGVFSAIAAGEQPGERADRGLARRPGVAAGGVAIGVRRLVELAGLGRERDLGGDGLRLHHRNRGAAGRGRHQGGDDQGGHNARSERTANAVHRET
jgi:hypothetical protein